MILNDLNEQSSATTRRPDVVGSKRELKDRHGNIGKMIGHYLRYMTSQYNLQSTWNNWPGNSSDKGNGKTPVEEILMNFDYYQAQQNEYPYGYLTEGTAGEELPAPYSNGHEIYQTVQHMVGPVIKGLKRMAITVESEDPSVKSEKARRVSAITSKKELEDIFEKFKALGANYSPERRFDKDLENAIHKASRSPAHKVESFGLDILNHINNTNSTLTEAPKAFRDTVIGRQTGVDYIVRNGRIFRYPIEPWNLIYDRNNDDEHNRYSLFKGYIKFLSKEEIYQSYKLTKDEKEIIDELFEKGPGNTENYPGLFPDFSSTNGFNWINGDAYRRMAVVKGCFVATISGKDDDYHTLYSGTLIGNHVLVDFGEETNIVHDMADPTWPLMPIWIYSPETIMGRNVSPVDRFRDMQSDCDAYLYKVKQKISNDLDKNYVIFADALGDVKDEVSIIEDFKNHHITVINRADGESEFVSNGKAIETVDLSLDPNVIKYVELRKERKQDMKDVVSQSNITNGMQQTYIGGGTQQQTIELAANGVASIYTGFFQHFSYQQQYTLNVAKTMLLEPKNRAEAELILSESSMDFWEALNDEELQVEDLIVRVELEDSIDDEDRQYYQDMATQMALNPAASGFNMLDAVSIKEARTTRELRRMLKENLEQKERKAERANKAAAQNEERLKGEELAAKAMMDERSDANSLRRDQVREAPKHEANDIKREELNMQRNLNIGSESGLQVGPEE